MTHPSHPLRRASVTHPCVPSTALPVPANHPFGVPSAGLDLSRTLQDTAGNLEAMSLFTRSPWAQLPRPLMVPFCSSKRPLTSPGSEPAQSCTPQRLRASRLASCPTRHPGSTAFKQQLQPGARWALQTGST